MLFGSRIDVLWSGKIDLMTNASRWGAYLSRVLHTGMRCWRQRRLHGWRWNWGRGNEDFDSDFNLPSPTFPGELGVAAGDLG